MENEFARYLQQTPLLDFNELSIRKLIMARRWRELPEKKKVSAIYYFVRDEILFGYNEKDNLKASEVLCDGIGQCNTKGTLFMALLRGVSVPCRIHGFTITKKLQHGAQRGLTYLLAPKEILHSWVEVYYDGKWLNLEGIILDKQYLNALQSFFYKINEGFMGYGVATTDFRNPKVDFNGSSTYIQKEGIVQDFGVYDSPDEFYKEHRQNLSPIKKWLYVHIGRKSMNNHVATMRKMNRIYDEKVKNK